MPTAVFISPHLDDAAFSCGGTLIALRERGWNVVLCTMFTASMPHPQGFALACQLDKGLPPNVDYMALRRVEDHNFARIAGIDQVLHRPYPEAPHRGYHSAPELFAGVQPNDHIWQPIADDLRQLLRAINPDLLFAPQGLGNHVDHLHVIRAVLTLDLHPKTCWYRDTPYAMRQPDAPPAPLLPSGLREIGIAIEHTLARKIAGCAAYTTQLGFQFGGARSLHEKLSAFHDAEAARLGIAVAAEALLVPPTVPFL